MVKWYTKLYTLLGGRTAHTYAVTLREGTRPDAKGGDGCAWGPPGALSGGCPPSPLPPRIGSKVTLASVFHSAFWTVSLMHVVVVGWGKTTMVFFLIPVLGKSEHCSMDDVVQACKSTPLIRYVYKVIHCVQCTESPWQGRSNCTRLGTGAGNPFFE